MKGIKKAVEMGDRREIHAALYLQFHGASAACEDLVCVVLLTLRTRQVGHIQRICVETDASLYTNVIY